MNFLGIDPGLSGGIAAIDESGTPYTWKTPTIKSGGASDYDPAAMAAILARFPPANCRLVKETVHAIMGSGAKATFNFGRGVGLWEGIIATLGIPWEGVTPQKWKAEMLSGFGDKRDKGNSLIQARRLFPTVDLKYKNCEGMAEALLIAEWRRRRA